MRSFVYLTPHEKKDCSLPSNVQLRGHIGPFFRSTMVALYPLDRSKQNALTPLIGPERYVFFFLDVFTVPSETEISSSSREQRQRPG